MDDSDLLREYVDHGSDQAFAQLVERHLDLVYSAAARRVNGDPHRAAEVTQMVFTDLARKAASLRSHPLLQAWLHQSTRWAAAIVRRSEKRRMTYEQAAAAERVAMDESEAAHWDRVRPVLDDALDSLSESDRAAVLLRFFEDRPFAEVGARLGVNENAARMRVERALEKLQALLARRGVTSTSAALSLALVQNAVAASPAGLALSTASAALSGVGVAGSGTGVIATTFLMTKIQIGLASLLAVVLSLGLVRIRSDRALYRADAARLNDERKTLQLSSTALEKKLADQATALRTLPSPAELPPAIVLTPEQVERQRLDTTIRKGELDQNYPALFRLLRLPPDQLDQFKTLLVERNQAIYDAARLAKEQGVVFATPAEYKEVTQAPLAEIDARIASLIGGGKLGQLRYYEDTQPARQMFARFSHDGAEDKRVESLVSLFYETCPTYFADNYDPGPWPGLPKTFIERAVELSLYTAEGLKAVTASEETIGAFRRIDEIARKAAQEGRLKLSKSSAKDYPTPRTTPSAPNSR